MARYDVVVVGCGPAGALALRRCAELGLKAIGFEACRMPRPKPCAGVLYPRVLEDFEVAEQAIASKLRGVRVVAPSGNTAVIVFEEPGAVVYRDLFDQALTLESVRRGARVVEGVRAVDAKVGEPSCTVLLDRGGAVEAGFVIAADGVASAVARALGRGWRREELAVTLQAVVEVPEEERRSIGGFFEVHYSSRRTPGGWTWAVERGSHVLVGLGYPAKYVARPSELREKLDSFIAWRFRSFKVLGYESHPIPIAGPKPKEELVASRRVLLAGDAGGFVRRDTGEGVYYAMWSGVAAAEAVYERYERPEDLVDEYYERLGEYGLHQLYVPTELVEALLDDEGIERFVEDLRKLASCRP